MSQCDDCEEIIVIYFQMFASDVLHFAFEAGRCLRHDSLRLFRVTFRIDLLGAILEQIASISRYNLRLRESSRRRVPLPRQMGSRRADGRADTVPHKSRDRCESRRPARAAAERRVVIGSQRPPRPSIQLEQQMLRQIP